MLQAATQQGFCKVIVLCLPNFYGENVTNGLIKPIFGNAARKKRIEWLIIADIPHQFVYTKDAARLFFMLSEEASLPDYFQINYRGVIVPSIMEWNKTISRISGSPDKVKVISKTILGVLSWFVPVVREPRENFYQFENTIILVDARVKKQYRLDGYPSGPYPVYKPRNRMAIPLSRIVAPAMACVNRSIFPSLTNFSP